MRALKLFDKHLSENNMEQFRTRFREGYDINDSTDKGQMYAIYRELKELTDGNNNGATSNATVNDAPIPAVAQLTTENHNEQDVPIDDGTAPPQNIINLSSCLLYTSPSPRDKRQSRMPSSA